MLLCEWKVKGEVASGNSSGFQPKLMTCVRNVAFLGETPKTTLQEVRLNHDHRKNLPPKTARFHPKSTDPMLFLPIYVQPDLSLFMAINGDIYFITFPRSS